MFTALAVGLLLVVAWWAIRDNNRERETYDANPAEDQGIWLLLLHIRQDAKLVSYLLAAVVVMLGVLADRV